jgi:hypothetical protein
VKKLSNDRKNIHLIFFFADVVFMFGKYPKAKSGGN